jgi:hypothetical protein
MSMDFTGIGAVSDFLGKVADKIWPDKIAQEAERNKFILATSELANAGELEKLKMSLSTILAEANSTDPWTSRARPSFMYVMYVMILSSIPVGIIYAFFPAQVMNGISGMKLFLQAIPDALYALFGVGYTGYTVMRTVDKRNESKGT